MAAKARLAHCVLPHRERPPSREQHEEATARPASASLPRRLAAVPMHLLTCLSVPALGGGTRGARVGGWREKEGRAAEGGSGEGSAPGGCAQAQWQLPQAGGGNMAE